MDEQHADAFNGLAVSVFKSLVRNSESSRNVLCSPVGIASAAFAGSAAVGAPLQNLVREVSHYVRQSHLLSSRFYVDKGHAQWGKKVLLENEFATDMELADFSNPQEVVGSIDKWAHGVTRGAINQVLSASAVKGQHSCLVNVASFSGDWEEAFAPGHTCIQPFFNEPGHSALVPTMMQTLDVHFVRLDAYQDGSHLVLFLPTLQGGLTEVLHSLATWKDVKDAMTRTVWTSDVTVMLPRLCLVSETFHLGSALKGHHLAPAAGVVHKAAMDVYEDGYRGPPTASTMLSICTNVPANDPVHFAVDRPFLFAVIRGRLLYMMGVIRKLPLVIE